MSDTTNDPELKAMKHVLAVVERDEESTPDTPMGESLRRLAKHGDMEAALILDEMDSPGKRIDELLLDAAVEFDPYWEKLADGHYRHREGGAHKTPEELIAAFVKSAGDDLLAVLSEETKEKILEEALRQEIGTLLDEKVAAGELRRVVNDDGDLAYEKTAV